MLRERDRAFQGKFAPKSGERLATYLNARQCGIKEPIYVVYMAAFAEEDAQGLPTRPSSNTPVRPKHVFMNIRWTAFNSVINPTAATTFPTRLAHELVRALIDEGEHSNDANTLLAEAGGLRRTDRIEFGQVCAIRDGPSHARYLMLAVIHRIYRRVRKRRWANGTAAPSCIRSGVLHLTVLLLTRSGAASSASASPGPRNCRQTKRIRIPRSSADWRWGPAPSHIRAYRRSIVQTDANPRFSARGGTLCSDGRHQRFKTFRTDHRRREQS